MLELHRVLRRLIRDRPFSLAVIVSLAVAVGSAGALLSLFNAVVLRPLAVRQPERLVAVYPGRGEALLGVPVRTMRALQEAQSVVNDLCGYARGALEVEVRGVTTPHTNEAVTGGCYRMLGVEPFLGRLIDQRDAPDTGEPAPVAVLSHRFWTRAFDGDPAVVGQTLRANGVPLTVIGVTPPTFDGIDVDRAPDLTVPLGTMSRLSGRPADNTVALLTLGRLRDDATIAEARAQLTAIWPGLYSATNPVPAGRPPSPAAAAEALRVESIARGLSEQRTLYGLALPYLLALSTFLVLLACLNVGALFLARTAARTRELEIHTMLGASRWRVGVPLGIEAVLLAAAAALLAVPIASSMSRLLATTMWIRITPTTMDVSPDAAVLALIGIAGLIIGLIVSLPSLGLVLLRVRDLGRTVTVVAATRWRRALIVSQVVVSLILVFSAGLFARNLSGIRSIDPGHAVDDVRWTRLELVFGQPRTIDQAAYFRPLLEQIRAVPGVTGAAASLAFPTTELRHVVALAPFRRAGAERSRQDVGARMDYASPGFFETLDVPLLEGRDLTWADAQGQANVAIVNRALATRLFPGGDAVGSSIHYDAAGGPASFTIVGIVANASPGDVRIGELPIVYLPLLQHPQFMAAPILVVRTTNDAGLERAIRNVIEPPGRHRVAGVQTIHDQADRFQMRERVLAGLATAFAALSLLVGGIGLYALLTHAVVRRRREMGLRMALGATGTRVVALVMRDGLRLVAIGIALGVPAALASGRAARALLFQRSPYDAASLAVACLMMLGVALLACGWPAMRATHLMPADVLRNE